MLYRKWIVHRPDQTKSQALAQAIGAGRLLSDVLVARGYETPEDALELLAENRELPDPFLLKDMDKAVTRIQQALDEDQPMVIFGDYDADGITATALLYTCLESLGAEVYYKLPNRNDDDYGLSPALVEQIAQRLGNPLVITVDNGTSALPAVEKATELGLDVVVTDHHLPGDTLPHVAALVNPCREDDDSPFGNLSGVGVAFMLAAALEGCEPGELLPVFGDLVALGTVADVMKLTGENRTLVRAGLAVLQETERPGLAALIEACGLSGKTITVENISYSLSPKLNAAGRMDDATCALQLLLAEDEEEAAPLVEALQEHNAVRQKTEQQIVEAIAGEIDADSGLANSRILVVAGEGWHPGVIGIVASRLVERYAKPTIVISFDGEEGRGSGRSYAGFSLHASIASCQDLLIRFGGHDLAAGLSIRRENVPEFRRRVNAWALENSPVPTAPELCADAPISLVTLTVAEVQGLDRLAPCGSGNPAPRFLLENAKVDAIFPVSEGRHCRLRLRQGGQTLFAVLFGTGPDLLAYHVGDAVDALLTLSIYEGRGEAQVSARVIELRPAGMSNEHVLQSALFESFSAGGQPAQAQIPLLNPTREDTAAIYRTLRDNGGLSYTDLRPVFARFGEEITGRLLTALAALEELGLIRRNEATGCYQVVTVQEKKDLKTSVLLRRLEV